MQNRTMIIIAVTLFIVAAFLVLAMFAAFYLSSSKTYPAPVLTRNVSENQKITGNLLKMKQFSDPVEKKYITDSEKIVGRVADRDLNKNSKLTPADLRDKFKIVKSIHSVPAGNRLDKSMLKMAKVNKKPDKAVENMESLLGKMVRSGIPANVAVLSSHVYNEEKNVVVAARPIKTNTLVRTEQLKVVSRPVFPEDAISDPEKVVSQAIKRHKSPGDVLRKSDLYKGKKQLSYFIPLYKRAVKISVDVSKFIAYQLRPGDFIDLYVYQPKTPGFGGKQEITGGESLHVLQKVADAAEVLALNQRNGNIWSKKTLEKKKSGKKGGGKVTYNGITLAVSLKEAEKISLIQGMKSEKRSMNFYLILRPRIQESNYGLRKMTNLELFNPRGHKEAEEFLESHSVKVIQGEDEETYRVPGY